MWDINLKAMNKTKKTPNKQKLIETDKKLVVTKGQGAG